MTRRAARFHARGSHCLLVPKHAIRSVLPDSSAWEAWNPAGITPLFVLIDRQGIVRYRAAGASAITAVATKVKELLR